MTESQSEYPFEWWHDYSNVVLLTAYLAERGWSGKEVAYAVEKPWKHVGAFLSAQRWRDGFGFPEGEDE